MRCVETVAATSVNLCDLLGSNKVTIRVLEMKSDDGDWVWRTQTTPRLLTWDPGCWAGGEGWKVSAGQGLTVEDAVGSLCRSLSGSHVKIERKGWLSKSVVLNLTQVKVSL